MSWMQNMRDGQISRPRESSYVLLWPRFCIGLWFCFMETAYFGWNIVPGSPAELICDGLALLIAALAVERRTR